MVGIRRLIIKTPAGLGNSAVTIFTAHSKAPVPPPPLASPYDPLPGEGKPKGSRFSIRCTPPSRSSSRLAPGGSDVEIYAPHSAPPPPTWEDDPVLVGSGQRRASGRPPPVLRHIPSEKAESLGELSCGLSTPGTAARADEWAAYDYPMSPTTYGDYHARL